MYAKARRGELSAFTGVNDPYEQPINPEITIDTTALSIDECISQIIHFLKKEGYLKSDSSTLSTEGSMSINSKAIVYA